MQQNDLYGVRCDLSPHISGRVNSKLSPFTPRGQILSQAANPLAAALERRLGQLGAAAYAPGEEWKARWKTKPVNIVTFCNDFLHEPLWPRQEKAALQIWGEDPNVWRDDDLPTKILLEWGKGSGKDRTISKNVDFAAYRLANLLDPWDHFHKPAGDPIDFINVSFNAEQAKDVFFKHLKAMMRKTICPVTGRNWFEDRGIDLREGKRNIQARSIVLVPGGMQDENLITIHAGDSKTFTGEGLNLIGALFDELGCYAPVDKAIELFNALWDTATSRFKGDGFTLGISYKYAENDAMEVEFQAAERQVEADVAAGVPPSAYCDRAATWEVNLTTTRETFAKQYARNPERAKRVYECLGGGSDTAFFRYREEVRGRCNHDRIWPIKGRVWRIADPSQVEFEEWFHGTPGVQYHAHIDLATGQHGRDKAGFVLAHSYEARPTWSPDYLQRLQIEGVPNPEASGDFQKAVYMDLALQFIAPQGGEVRFAGIIDFLVRLRSLGFELTVSYDGWQSRGELQRLQELGFVGEVLSVDKTPGPANTAKELLYNGLLDYYPHPVLLREAEELEEDPKTGKVDHPEKSKRRLLEEGEPNGSKDVWDCLAACCDRLTVGGKTGRFEIGFGDGENPVTKIHPAGVQVVEAEVWR